MPADAYRIVEELIKELGPQDEPGFWWLDSGNLQWFAGEAHKRLKAAALHVAAVPTADAKPTPSTTKLKITEVGQPCRDCQTPVIRKEHRKPPKYKGQSFYYAYWFHCPGCKKDFFVNEAAVMFDAPGTLPTPHKAPETHIGDPGARFDPEAIGDGAAPW